MSKYHIQPALVAARIKMLEAEVRLGKEFDGYDPVYMDHPADVAGAWRRKHFTRSAKYHAMTPTAPTSGRHTKCALLLDAAAHTYSLHGEPVDLDVCPSCLHCFAVEELAVEEEVVA